MTLDPTGRVNHEERLSAALLDYLDDLHSGRPPDREAFLAANPDPDLRDDLLAFIDGHEEVVRLTAPLRGAGSPAAGKSAPSRMTSIGRRGIEDVSSDASVGAAAAIGELGDFHLLRELGRGGMGVVYEAEQISLRRRVALKVLPFAAAVDARRLQHFKTEALAAANLQHEKIVPVHAVGCERGVHYYAMQYIEGQSLADLLAGVATPADGDKSGAFGHILERSNGARYRRDGSSPGDPRLPDGRRGRPGRDEHLAGMARGPTELP